MVARETRLADGKIKTFGRVTRRGGVVVVPLKSTRHTDGDDNDNITRVRLRTHLRDGRTAATAAASASTTTAAAAAASSAVPVSAESIARTRRARKTVVDVSGS